MQCRLGGVMWVGPCWEGELGGGGQAWQGAGIWEPGEPAGWGVGVRVWGKTGVVREEVCMMGVWLTARVDRPLPYWRRP